MAQSNDQPLNATLKSFARQWQHRPDTPVKVSPFFSWPLEPKRLLSWLSTRWLSMAENLIVLVLASISWFWFQPALERCQTLSVGWIVEIYARNLVLMGCVAGALHVYFYSRQKQSDRLQFDTRPLKRNSRLFSFNNQVHDNMFWTLTSGVAVWTLYEVLMFWAMANDYIAVLQWSDSPIWFGLMFLLTPVWISLHFYWVHRWMHLPSVYGLVHALHHRNNNVGPWSGLSMHPLEHLVFFSSVLIHCVVAAHPLHILFHLQHQALTAASSHTGFESLLVKDKKRLALGTFHHQMHHRYLDCNYGNLEVPLDKWFGSFHDGSEASHQSFVARRRQRAARS